MYTLQYIQTKTYLGIIKLFFISFSQYLEKLSNNKNYGYHYSIAK